MNINANSCGDSGFQDLIVSYVYDEASTDERRLVETHILECSSCIEEFTGLSNARLSVFEWQQKAFSGLQTPTFALPEVESANGRVNDETGSVFGRLRALIIGQRGPAFAFAAFLLLIVGGLSFIFLTKSGPVEQLVVANAPAAVAPGRSEPPTPLSATVPQNEILPAVPARDPEKFLDEPRVTKAAAHPRPARPGRGLTSRAEKPGRTRDWNRNAPVLTDFDETADRSLMLSDLFDDEVGSIH